jgi:hypothetical protein
MPLIRGFKRRTNTTDICYSWLKDKYFSQADKSLIGSGYARPPRLNTIAQKANRLCFRIYKAILKRTY